ncbi:PAQR family membrane homeostasis protein TrhA [Planctobacterium marinum]|uniref:PAQR family membrane homeostasis protein TrhA n=1 Tax=Planctobacterium marinum TaxID=1631968 RepID=UPI001E543035|nr:hemolysin III family protein [Planctobacterium marinum]MCC2605264.1 hemolysin III family protein [Planctobacterium marinum]
MVKAESYSRREELINIWSHFFGFLLAIIGLAMLLHKSVPLGVMELVSVAIFGSSMILLFLASTLYHRASTPRARAKLRVFDHCAIFVFIAGTYTPFALLGLTGVTGWWIFGISWGLAVVGIVLKLFFTGRFKLLSTGVYLFMGWLILFAGKTLFDNLSAPALFWLTAGGVVYTLGAVLYSFKSLPYTHAIFHIMVMLGGACHFYSVYEYVL